MRASELISFKEARNALDGGLGTGKAFQSSVLRSDDLDLKETYLSKSAKLRLMEEGESGKIKIGRREFDKYLIAVIIIALVVFSVQAYFVSKIRFIGSSDPAHFANVAENFLKGNGFTLDYINEYFLKLPAISHPEEWGFSGAALIIAPF